MEEVLFLQNLYPDYDKKNNYQDFISRYACCFYGGGGGAVAMD